MQSLLNFLVVYQNWIYAILAITGVIYLRRLIIAWREWRSTIFGLERDSAQTKLNASLAMVILILLLFAAEFICLTFVVSEWPQVQLPQNSVPTEGPDTGILATPDGTEESGSKIVIVTPTSGGISETMNPQQSTVQGSLPESQAGIGCVPGQVEWISPKPGEEISGLYELVATVNFQDMGFYKYQYSLLTDQVNWTAISAGNLPVLTGTLGVLATTEIPNGDYVIRLTVVEKNNTEHAPCDVAVRILNQE
ncbi:MAG: hypothetical protein AB9907_08850 [Flexilinea sp.]